MAHDERAVMAANNNADIYSAMFSAWGLRYDRLPFAFVGKDPPPPYHSNLTILAPGCRLQVIEELKALARSFQGVVGLKDSFHEFDLRENGFERLFGADWIWKRAETVRIPDGWTRVESPRELKNWEAAWKRCGSPADARVFRDCCRLRISPSWARTKAASLSPAALPTPRETASGSRTSILSRPTRTRSKRQPRQLRPSTLISP